MPMDDQAENSRKFEERHVPAALVPDWDQYCPLVPIWQPKVSVNDVFFERSNIEFCIVKTLLFVSLASSEVIQS